jgi:uncharacterized protein (TIGR03435 family)
MVTLSDGGERRHKRHSEVWTGDRWQPLATMATRPPESPGTELLGEKLESCTRTKDNFDLQLEWTPESPEGPSVMAALAEQLGLKLEGSRAPVGVVVIDRAERPSGN